MEMPSSPNQHRATIKGRPSSPGRDRLDRLF
uniref:Uncharacterized protein n=1 Tax=Utricularia reniformis TaxID=192314 RepID=A0A1Y0B260_9LAMI|nr:hypothetical protein AEK19_MT1226 [Utricularia reniformis]ART31439.1 hypothetical protein AEK19_MT1226 [Utricularia reniformis]